jgi:hypothetical protein
MLYYYIMDARVSYLSHLEWSLCQRVHDADRLQIIIACLQRIFFESGGETVLCFTGDRLPGVGNYSL